MKIYLFLSETEEDVRAFTSDPTGANLPPDYAPWRSSGTTMPLGNLTDPVCEAVTRDGFFLVSTETRATIPQRARG